MYIVNIETVTQQLFSPSSFSWLEEELRELEDTYADCLADDVDAKTLLTIWSRIKEIKSALALD